MLTCLNKPIKRTLTIITYAYMFKETLKRTLTIVAYAYMFMESFKRTLTNYSF